MSKTIYSSSPLDDFFQWISNQMMVDGSFQRENVWSTLQKRSFITSVLFERAITPFVLADIESAIQTSEAEGDELGVQILKDQYTNGFRYSILDGQNRRATVVEFLSDKFTISGTFCDADGDEQSCNNVFFSDLPQRLKDKFMSSHIPLTYVYRRAYEEMSELFLNLQEGEPPTPQEKRHAINSPFKVYISNLRPIFTALFERVQTVRKKINRKLDEEVLSQAIMTLIKSRRDKSCGQSDLDMFYNLGKGKFELESVPEYDPKELKRAVAILKTVKSSIVHNKMHSTQSPARTFWALVAVCEYLYDHNLNIKDGSWADFYKFVYSLDKKLLTESKERQAIDTKKAAKAKKDEPGDSQYYWWWTSVPHHPKARQNRINTLIKRFEYELPQEFVLDSDEKEYHPYEDTPLFSNQS